MDLLAWWTGASLLVLCVLVVLVLLGLRVGQARWERRRDGRRAPLWRLVMLLATGEDDEVVEVRAALQRLTPREVAAVEDDVVALLPKLRGAGADRVRDLLHGWGSHERAARLAAGRSVVHRCRGLYRLGVLADPATLPLVRRGLGEREHVVRRVALQAVGSFTDPRLVHDAVLLAAAEPALRRDLLAALDRIGAPAAPVLRDLLGGALVVLRTEPSDERSLRLATLGAEALGLVDDGTSAPVLVEVLGSTRAPALQAACADALGRLGSPVALAALAAACVEGTDDVRRRAAGALGLVGGPAAVAALAHVLDDEQVEVARAAALGLARCGAPGRAVLEASAAPVAREVRTLLALDEPVVAATGAAR